MQDNQAEEMTQQLMDNNVVPLPEGWFVDISHIFSENNPCLFLADTLSGCSIRIERTGEGVKVEGYIMPDTSPKFSSTLDYKGTKQ